MFYIFQEVISTPYIVFTKAKLVIGLLQGEERKLHQKIQKKISKVESAKTEQNSHHAWGVRNFRTPEEGVRTSHTIRTAKGGCAKFSHTWSSCLPKAISSSFQLQIIHGLKRWILDFLSFEMVYSMWEVLQKCQRRLQLLSSVFLLASLCFSPLIGLS